jgi:outer membrane protein TolC
MKRISSYILLALLLCSAHWSVAQDTLYMTHKEFLAIVSNYHPLMFRYKLQNEIAAAEVQQARGGFDPQLNGKKGAKTIDGVNYYDENAIGLNIPTWYGIELNGNYTSLEGERLNNSDTKGGLYQFGVTVPLAKNLWYDQRRAILDQAKIGQRMTATEQQLMTNQLLLDADNAYWNWVKHHDAYLLQKKALSINRERQTLILKAFSYGERAAMDTTEALSQLQNFELQMEDAYLKYVKATLELSLFLWKEDGNPYEVDSLFYPKENITGSRADEAYLKTLSEIQKRVPAQHASVQYYLQKQTLLESQRKLKWQSFLPKLDFTYNFLNKENYSLEYTPLFNNNYQYGLKLEIPLLWREARAGYRAVNAKLRQNQLDADLKSRELQTKIVTYTRELLNYQKQISIVQANILNYRRLLDAEETLFRNGESSIFLINSRENKLLDAEQKLLDLRLKFINSYNTLKWLNENFISGD